MQRFRRLVASVATLMAVGVVVPIAVPSAAAATGSISGTVTCPTPGACGGITVTAQLSPTAAVEGNIGTATTAANGSYTVSGLAVGDFLVTFEKDGLVPIRYNQVSDFNAGTLVNLTDGEAETGIDATMSTAYSISGTVTGPDNTPLSGVTVTVNDDSDPPLAGAGYFGQATTAADGTWTVDELYGGGEVFRVEFFKSGLITELYDDTQNTLEDDPVTITASNVTGIDARMEASTPSAPLSVSATAGNATATVSWAAPNSSGGAGGVIVGYTVTSSPGGLTCTTAALTCNVTGLTNGTPYTFTVRADNTGSPAIAELGNPRGLGTASAATSPVTPAAPGVAPGAPTGVTAAPGASSAVVTWVAPSSVGSSAITGYTVTSSPGGFTCTTTGALSCTVTGLTDGVSYTFTVTAANAAGNGPASAASAAVVAGATFTSLTPARLMETRSGLSTADDLFNGIGVRTGGSITELTVAGRGGVAADASAAVLNVTVTEAAASGFVTVWPCGVDRPNASSVNYVAGDTVANAVTAKIGTGGKVCFFTSASTHLVVDVGAAYPAGASFAPLTPARLMETRAGLSTVDGESNGIGIRTAGSVTELTVADRGGVAADAEAVVLNVTVTEAAGAGFVTVWPCGVDRPNASNVNYVAGDTVANAVTAKIGTGGKVCFFTSNATHLVVDVAGAYPAGSSFESLTPGRLMETRAGLSTVDGQSNGIGIRTGGSTTELTVTDRGGVSATAGTVVLNVTVTEPAAAGFITVWPCGVDRPNASNVNYVAGDTVANAVTAKVGTGGKVCFFTSASTHLVVDVTGYFPA